MKFTTSILWLAAIAPSVAFVPNLAPTLPRLHHGSSSSLRMADSAELFQRSLLATQLKNDGRLAAPDNKVAEAAAAAVKVAQQAKQEKADKSAAAAKEAEAKAAADKALAATKEAAEKAKAAAEKEAAEKVKVAAEKESAEKAKIVAEKEAAEKAKIAAEKAAAEKVKIAAEKEAADKAKIVAEKEAAEKAAAEKVKLAAEKEAAEKEAAEKAKIAAEKAAAEKVAAEKEADKQAKIAAEKAAAEQVRLAAEKEAAEKAKVIAEKEAAEKAKLRAEEMARLAAKVAAEKEAAEKARIVAEEAAAEKARLIAEKEAAEKARVIAAEEKRVADEKAAIAAAEWAAANAVKKATLIAKAAEDFEALTSRSAEVKARAKKIADRVPSLNGSSNLLPSSDDYSSALAKVKDFNPRAIKERKETNTELVREVADGLARAAVDGFGTGLDLFDAVREDDELKSVVADALKTAKAAVDALVQQSELDDLEDDASAAFQRKARIALIALDSVGVAVYASACGVMGYSSEGPVNESASRATGGLWNAISAATALSLRSADIVTDASQKATEQAQVIVEEQKASAADEPIAAKAAPTPVPTPEPIKEKKPVEKVSVAAPSDSKESFQRSLLAASLKARKSSP